MDGRALMECKILRSSRDFYRHPIAPWSLQVEILARAFINLKRNLYVAYLDCLPCLGDYEDRRNCIFGSA